MKFEHLVSQPKQQPVNEEQLDEAKLTLNQINQWVDSPESRGILMGFEAELIYRNLGGDGELDWDNVETDYDVDETARNFDQIRSFFAGDAEGATYEQNERAQGNNSRRDLDRLIAAMEEDYGDARKDAASESWDELDRDEQLKLIREKIKEQVDPDEWIEDYIANELDGEDTDENRIEAESAFLDHVWALAEESLAGREFTEYLTDAQSEHQDNLLADDEFFPVEDWLELNWPNMSEIEGSSRYGRYVSWPYTTEPEYRDGSDYDYDQAQGLARRLQRTLNGWYKTWSRENSEQMSLPGIEQGAKYNVVASGDYHGTPRDPDLWIFEPDGSLEADQGDMPAELISPPMPLREGLAAMKTFFDWAHEENAYSNHSTGLHIGLSLPNHPDKINYIKLALMLGDKQILRQFEREAVHFCESSLGKLQNNVQSGEIKPENIRRAFDLMRRGLGQIAHTVLEKSRHDKYSSINVKDGYIEFRSMGGDRYLDENYEERVFDTVKRFAYAMYHAQDEESNRREYLGKLGKLLHDTNIKYYDPEDPANAKQPTKFEELPAPGMRPYVLPGQDDMLSLFTDYMIFNNLNLTSLETLKQRLRTSQLKRRAERLEAGTGELHVWQISIPGTDDDGETVRARSREGAILKYIDVKPAWFRGNLDPKKMVILDLGPVDSDSGQTGKTSAEIDEFFPAHDNEGNYEIYRDDNDETVYRFFAGDRAEAREYSNAFLGANNISWRDYSLREVPANTQGYGGSNLFTPRSPRVTYRAVAQADDGENFTVDVQAHSPRDAQMLAYRNNRERLQQSTPADIRVSRI